jgi:uncharacterized protein (DUF305 family)
MHEALSSLKSTGNNDEHFVQLMLPHHRAAIDMAKGGVDAWAKPSDAQTRPRNYYRPGIGNRAYAALA